MTLLAVQHLVAGYGPVQVLDGLDLSVEAGEIVVVLGANGAGKTTTLRALSGMIPAKGSVVLDGTEVIGRKPESLVDLGVAHVPQGRGTFPDLTVEENLRVGGFTRPSDEVAEDMERWFEVFPRLKERYNQAGGTLSGGEQQMLAIGRALVTGGELLLLDEPSMGIAPKLVAEIFHTITQIAQNGQTIMLVEQNAMMAMEIASYCYVLETGNLTYEGTSEHIRANERIAQAYLG